ncbi:hypothetical protein [Streptomyces rimosus]|nr:hypothetical protein [Streptomyces rimosus]
MRVVVGDHARQQAQHLPGIGEPDDPVVDEGLDESCVSSADL